MIKYKRVFVGSLCDNNCIYCPYPQKASRDLAEVKQELEEKNDFDSVEIHGGEPTVRPDLLEIIRHAKRLGYKRIKLVTNARALANWQAVNLLINEGCYLYEVKVWGPNSELHDYLTRTPGSFYEMIQGVRNLRSTGVIKNTGCSVFISFFVPMVKENYVYAEQIGRALFPLSPDRLVFSFFQPEFPLEEALFHLQSTVETCIFSKVWATTERVPPCLMSGFEYHISEFLGDCSGKYSQLSPCENCIYSEVCPGPAESFQKFHGEEELKPLKKSKHLEDLKALKNE